MGILDRIIKKKDEGPGYILYLHIGESLPKWFYSLVKELSYYNLALIPIEGNKLSSILDKKISSCHIVSIAATLREWQELQEFLKKNDHTLREKNAALHVISSHYTTEKLFNWKRHYNLNNYCLPIETSSLAQKLSGSIQQREQQKTQRKKSLLTDSKR